MSSVQSFLKQRAPGNTVFSYSGLTSSNLYVLIAGSSNYVGNYPNGIGYMAPALNVSSTLAPNGTNLYVRDMGKTVQAVLSATSGAGVPVSGTLAPLCFFRQVQVLDNSLSALLTSGVQGTPPASNPSGNPGDMGYNTYYVLINVGGKVSVNSASPGALVSVTPVAPILGTIM